MQHLPFWVWEDAVPPAPVLQTASRFAPLLAAFLPLLARQVSQFSVKLLKRDAELLYHVNLPRRAHVVHYVRYAAFSSIFNANLQI